MPDSNDHNVQTKVRPEGKSDAKSESLPFTPRRFFRGLSHDVGRRSRLKPQHILAAIVIVAGGTWGATEIHERLTHVHEYDARITAQLITVSSRVTGWVYEIPVAEGDQIARDQVLVRLDDERSTLRVEELEAELRRVVAEVDGLRGLYYDKVAQLKETDETVAFYKEQFDHRRELLQRGLVNQDRFDSIARNLESARGRADNLRQEVGRLRARLGGSPELSVDDQPEVRVARTKLEQARLDLSDRTILSPVTGIIDRTFVEVGEYVSPGQRLAMVHDPSTIWIEANIKETEVRKLRVGQPVDVRVDAYPGERFVGTVAVIGSAATSRFALLPTPNPSGNFTKITQRLPVRIAIDQQDGKLRPGMMVEVNIDIRSD